MWVSKVKLYTLWVQLQSKHLPWTKLYKYRQREWANMKHTQHHLKSFWVGGKGHGMIGREEYEARIKKAMENYNDTSL